MRTCFQPAHPESQTFERVGQSDARLVVQPACRPRLQAYVDLPFQKGAGRYHNRIAEYLRSVS